MKKLVQFGAGKIGRSFIGQLFSRSAYEVVFIDIDDKLIDLLNVKRSYKVVIRDQVKETIVISNVRGIKSGERNKIIEEISTADIMSVSVGQAGLEKVAPVIADALKLRYQQNKQNALDIILAENMRNAAEYMSNQLKRHLPENYPFDELVGLIETSIGKMVPIMEESDLQEDPLQVFAESYNTLILDKLAFKNPVPDVKGLSPKENMKAWVDRKSFIHNLGHAVIAYVGYLHDKNFKYVWEALENDEIKTFVRETMLQSAAVLQKVYPNEFSWKSLVEHVDDLLKRFQNKVLGDTVFRVGCDLNRKLSREDRLTGVIYTARMVNMPYDKILFSLVCGLYFRATDSVGKHLPPDETFFKQTKNGIEFLLINICGFNKTYDTDLIQEAITINNEIIKKYNINNPII
jgi:mannitol-1-phosphate 5-dehydrogenase